ncbi:MAG: hypothetical protein WBF48_05590, partial [Halarcobacter sp.]
DSSYRSSQSQMIDNILKIALLNDDLELQTLAKESLEANSLLLVSRPSNTAYLLKTYMAYNKEYVSLKAKKEMLENRKYPNYPFLLKKAIPQASNEEQYLACKVGVCFSYSKEFNEIIQEIENSIKE